MNKSFTIIIATFLSTLLIHSSVGAYTLKAEWNEYKGDHFIINYHPKIPNMYVREFTRKCELYYRLIAERLGFRRFDYWSWENRAVIFIYQSKQGYIKDRGRPEWSAASVKIRKKAVSTYYFQEKFFDSILPHELTHIIIREFIGFDRKLPLWFEEGVAGANENSCYLKYLLPAKGFLDKGKYMPVSQLEGITRPASDSRNIFYASAASLVIFLLEDYPRGDFVELCRQLRDGNSFYGAMDKVYGIKDAEDLNEKFRNFLTSKNYDDIATSDITSVDW